MRTIEKIVPPGGFIVLFCLCCASCKKQVNGTEQISQSVKEKIFSLGFSTDHIQKIDDGYLAEGDIVLFPSELDTKPETKFLRIAGNEQYRTYNLLTGLPRTLTISLSSSFELSYASALDEAISRYNQEDLQIHFQRANGHADIEIVKGSGNWIAASGLPSGDGTAFHTIKLNPSKIPNGNGSSFTNFLATLMAHEMGHCIGFRHTDYMDRSFSCPGRPVNEGSGNLGAVNIPGTPVASDNGSWMLACITLNQNRPFNSNDRIALNYLY
jgi:dual-action HEIGH metallo-peptidase